MSISQCAHVYIWEHLYSPLSTDVHTHTCSWVSVPLQGFYCTGSMLGAELSCAPWGQQGPVHGHVSGWVSHCDPIPQHGMAPSQLQKQGQKAGHILPPNLQHLLGWLLLGCYCPQAVGSMPTCTDISVRPGSKHSPWDCWKIQAAGAYQA